jgi:O-antigen biosynthesis protein WbqP
MAKRALDLVLAVPALLLAAPVIALLVLCVRADSPGPGIFAQMRVGRHGNPFVCRKLRTMRVDTPNVPSHMAGRASMTRLGPILRRTKLDELPQLWNVVVGEMSLVGPRPCLPGQVELIDARRARGVLSARPGITGLAQVRGIDMSQPHILAEIDAEYVRRQTFRLDVAILFRTVFSTASQGDAAAR